MKLLAGKVCTQGDSHYSVWQCAMTGHILQLGGAMQYTQKRSEQAGQTWQRHGNAQQPFVLFPAELPHKTMH